jgi:ABC-2 type transport system permease protein
MRNVPTLLRRELMAYFLSPIAYIVILFFLLMMGFNFYLLLRFLNQNPADVSVMQIFFGWFFFWITLLIVVPVITMRLLAEEKANGTIETLMTAPVTDAEVVWSKYLGAVFFYIIMWAPTVAYMLILRAFTQETAPLDWWPIASGYLGTLLVGMLYLSVGCLASALTKNQIAAAIMCFVAITAIFCVSFFAFFATAGLARDVFSYLSGIEHMNEFARGMVDTRRVVFYLTCTVWMLFVTEKVLESRKWK